MDKDGNEISLSEVVPGSDEGRDTTPWSLPWRRVPQKGNGYGADAPERKAVIELRYGLTGGRIGHRGEIAVTSEYRAAIFQE